MAPASTPSGALILEEPLIRTSYELLRRSHRSAQRQVEKDFNAVQLIINGALKTIKAGKAADNGGEAISKLDQVAERARGLKRKLDDLQPSAAAPPALRTRVSYLNQLSKPPADAPQGGISTGTEEKGDNILDRYVIDYLLRTGQINTAKVLAKQHDIESLVDIKLFAELIKIETALVEKHSVAEALAWCGENRGTLKKTKNNLEFALRLQEFIELCRGRNTEAAIAYSRKNLGQWAASQIAEIQQGMTLLAFGPKTGVGSYRVLYDPDRWLAVRDQFRSTFLTLYAQPSQPLLALALSAGLSTLRLPSCVQHAVLPAAPPLHTEDKALGDYLNTDTTSALVRESEVREELHNHPDANVGNVDCPTCGPDMKVLAQEVPMSHHVNSTIVCRITGEVMDSSNPPLAFPNGYVYSTKALAEMAKSNFDVVTCPRTRESCAFSRLRKVFIS